ncbi:GAF domain-containing sensor histidine kinase [Aphanothece sacrum]|uniref:histidine kinase n=1 Tax=Aphanothece sacrum FPU1 TaxID=1920663 RepID=A0A401IE15_APHSA|nr:GAF domain-containing sensor histidine kinase [Aphanothece sacrum]GBF79522.1 two-component sensor histidine kinase [Aphanothece sacrum FPU1]GBF83937.1 two-component sensor histidine kinase [Aphanothece sacrum FPU3]
MPNLKKSNELQQGIINIIQNYSDTEAMLQEISSFLGQIFLIDLCLIITGFNDLNLLKWVCWTPEKFIKLPTKTLSELIEQPGIKKVIETSKVTEIANLNKSSNHPIYLTLEQLHFRELLGISTQFDGKVNGIILLGKTHAHEWTHQDKSLLKIASNLVAIAGHLSQLKISGQPSLNEKETPINFSSTDIPHLLEEIPILKVWWEATRNQLERQLQWNKQLVHNIITIMSDQTRNPLAIIKMGITTLRHRQLSPEDLEKRLDIMEKELQKLSNINDKILQLKTVKSQKTSLFPTLVNLETLIKEIVLPHEKNWQEDQRQCLNLEVNLTQNTPIDQQQIYIDIEHFKKILNELLINAGKFSLPNSIVCLEFGENKRHNQSEIIMSITNVSRCISKKNISYLFNPFYREQWVIDNAIPGIGLGLTIIKDLVELLNGKIETVCQPTDNPEHCIIIFKLTIPQS